MRKPKYIALAFAALLALTACSDGELTATTLLPGTVTTISDEVVDDVTSTVEEMQAEVTALATEVQNSEAAADLEASWSTLQTELTAAVASIGDDGTIDGSSVQDAIDEFQSDLDALGDDVEPALTEAWNDLQERLEGMMS